MAKAETMQMEAQLQAQPFFQKPLHEADLATVQHLCFCLRVRMEHKYPGS
jgi:hypothetical protein